MDTDTNRTNQSQALELAAFRAFSQLNPSKNASRVFDAICAAHPDDLTAHQISKSCGIWSRHVYDELRLMVSMGIVEEKRCKHAAKFRMNDLAQWRDVAPKEAQS